MKTKRFAIMIAMLLALPAQAWQEVKISAQQQAALGIETAPLSAGGAAEPQGFPAKVVLPNNQLFVVSSPLAGVVDQMLAASSAQVKKGQLLARIQSPGLPELERSFLQAETQYQLASENFDRDKRLFDEGIVSQSRYLATRSRHVEARAALLERRQMLKLSGFSDAAIDRLKSGSNLTTTLEISSPIEGVVLEQSAVAGQRVDVGSSLYQVAKLSPLWLEIQVPASRLDELSEGEEVRVPALGGVGKIVTIGKSVNAATQTVMVRALMTGGKLRPGLQAEAEIAKSRSDLVQIPHSALIREQGKAFVFVKTGQGFKAQGVQVLREAARSSLVSGLKGDEVIAVRGVAALKATLQGGN